MRWRWVKPRRITLILQLADHITEVVGQQCEPWLEVEGPLELFLRLVVYFSPRPLVYSNRER